MTGALLMYAALAIIPAIIHKHIRCFTVSDNTLQGTALLQVFISVFLAH